MSQDRPVLLLVDDDPMMRLLGVHSLKRANFEVIEAESGEQAIELFAARQPDAVLLDVVMPGLDGFETCAQLRALPTGVSSPILMMTALDDVPAIDRAYAAGATDFVTKPINYSLLAHRLRYQLRAANAFREARENAGRLATAQRIARLAQWEIDLRTGSLRWSDEARTIFGIPTVDGGLQSLLGRVHEADRDAVETAIAARERHTLEYRLRLDDGTEVAVHQEAERLVEPTTGRETLVGTIQDVTELRRAERQVQKLAYFDSLTGLPNRAFLRGFLAHVLADAKRHGSQVAVLAMDLDGFKRVNDTLGHAAGDMLLREVAGRVMESIRSADQLCWMGAAGLEVEKTMAAEAVAARLGGDEFVVVLTRLRRSEDAAVAARRIADRLASSFAISGTEVFISSSIGIACYPDNGTTVDTLLERADGAMYHAKESGRNRFQFFTSDIHDKARRRMEIESALRGAMAEVADPTDGQPPFHLEYQPKVEVPTGRVVGVEALLRWTSKERGNIPPADFIPIAEETGIIVSLGEWVLRAACQQAKAWELAGSPLRVAVNVSARQFRQAEFVTTVATILDQTELNPGLLELEITEGMVMEDTVASSRTLQDLKALGVRLALDDFGTGYSSLSYLTRLPIDALKIDRSFIRSIGSQERSETITSAIIALSRGLAMDVVVEGVETEEQLDFVRKQGSAEIQGFLFGKPMRAEALTAWRGSNAHRLSMAPPESVPRPRYVSGLQRAVRIA